MGRLDTHALGIVLALGLAGLAGCGGLLGGDDAASCTPGLTISPAPADGRLVLPDNAAHELTATVDLCGQGDILDYSFEWYYDADGDGVLNDTETADPVAQTDTWQLFACASDRGEHLVRVAADPITGGESYTAEFDVEIVETQIDQERPACYQNAISTIQNASTVDGSNVGQFSSVLECLEPYLENNLCDMNASYAAGLARFSVFMAKTPDIWTNRNDYSVDQIVEIFETEIEPMLARFEIVAEKAEPSFSFVVFNQFKITAFEDLPDLEGDESVYFVLQGEHDMGEVLAIRGVANVIRGLWDMGFAYDGLIRWLLDFPPLSELDFGSSLQILTKRIAEDPDFLTIVEEGSPNGRERLLRARGSFMAWFTNIQQAVSFVRQETDDQSDDLLRYWDCGDDGLCDCDKTNEQGVRVNNVLACPNNPEDYPGPDENEGNGRYDPGEPVGTDRVGQPNFSTVDLPSDLDEFNRQTSMLRENLRGPDALDLDELTGAPVESLLEGFLVPVPEIRLSEWFLTPTDPRLTVPLFDADTLNPIFDIESEDYDDLGYDGVANADETIVHYPNQRGLTLGTEYDPLTNPDPHFDDFDTFCNPVCNFDDGIDNDADGLVDDADRLVSGGFDFDQDAGVENNLVFDWVDLNFNFRHDATEPSEAFRDTGVMDHRGELVGADNGHWDFRDQPHTFPSGDNVLPVGTIDQTDPPNGISEDQIQRRGMYQGDDPAKADALAYTGLYDSFYFFFAEPEFSGVLQFPETIVSISGQELTKNAKFHRFLSKALELAGTFPIPDAERAGDDLAVPLRAAYGHPCSDEQACRDAVDLVQSDQ